ncbi:Thiamin diphosphate-binding fold superfamily protein [Prunus dulcis]|uniref:Thiamin diphosphate-binding fold superfamily protein n=1 Tax=Prunus dulcis TaxID=3755 RepID=A0A4Y1RE48_PRUDU|nr:Thiamin diphosphate-binding fold superfamily protein [Prunus dulcis]
MGTIVNHFKSLLLVTNNLSSWRSYSFVKRSQFAASFAHNLPVADRDFINSSTHFCPRRFESVKSEKMANNVDDNQALEFPEGKVKFTPKLRFISETADERECCYRVLDENGNRISSSNYVEVSKEVAIKMYIDMVTLQTMDTIFYEAQRQGRISFYVTAAGEEAINIASAAALKIDDIVFPQGGRSVIWRGFTIQEFANQCFSNKADYGKGRQMPIHYGSNKHNYVTVASTVATQLPQAVGAAYSLKMEKQDACAIAYVGDGGTSEGNKTQQMWVRDPHENAQNKRNCCLGNKTPKEQLKAKTRKCRTSEHQITAPNKSRIIDETATFLNTGVMDAHKAAQNFTLSHNSLASTPL